MQLLMTAGDSGVEVDRLARALAREIGEDADSFPVLAQAGAAIDDAFLAAVRRWQSGIGIIADGVVGPRCQVLLGLVPPQGDRFGGLELNVGNVSRLFPATKPANIARYLPYIEAALGVAGLTDRAMVVGALGTIRAETEGFVPISELQSKYNTPPGGAPFSLYDHRLGNDGAGDGARYRGRGFVQLTGRANYRTYGGKLGCDLEGNPDRANAPEVAALLLAVFLADKAEPFREAVANGRLDLARKLVNGGAHGLPLFRNAFGLAAEVWPPKLPGIAGARRRAAATRRPADSRHKTSRTKPDSADLRDRLFLPLATSLPHEFPSAADVGRFLPAYTASRLILNQGKEGACTGFGLTCVINYMRWIRSGLPKTMSSVSPRMLYTLARRHDEYDGENYDGSSCRGAIKGWFNNGVCLEEDWPYAPEKSNPARYGFAARATQNTLGVYYRIDTKSITDVQAAIFQHGAVFVSSFTHEGWDELAPRTAPLRKHSQVAGDRVRRQALAGRRPCLRPGGLQHPGIHPAELLGGGVRRRRLRRPDLSGLAGQRHGRVGGLARRARRRRRAPGGLRERAGVARRRRPQQVVGFRAGLPAQRRLRQRRPGQPLPDRGRAAAQAPAAGVRAAGQVVPRPQGGDAEAARDLRPRRAEQRGRGDQAGQRHGPVLHRQRLLSDLPGLEDRPARIDRRHPDRCAQGAAGGGRGGRVADREDRPADREDDRPAVRQADLERDEGERRPGVHAAARRRPPARRDRDAGGDLGHGAGAAPGRPFGRLDHPRQHAERGRAAPGPQGARSPRSISTRRPAPWRSPASTTRATRT